MKLKKLNLKSFLLAGLLTGTMFSAAKAEVMDTLNIDEVVVSASRINSKLKNIPQKIEIITNEDIKSIPSENLAEVIKRLSNIDIIQYPGLSATIGMRGFSPSAHSRSYTLMLINGKPAGTTNIAAISMNNVERIEIVKGPYATLYGSDAMGGVVNIITRQATDQPSGNVSLETGSFGYLGLSASANGKITNGVNFSLGFTRKEQKKNYRIGKNNFLDISEAQHIVLDSASYGDQMGNSTYEINALNGRIAAKLNDKWQADAELIYTFAHDIQLHGNYWGSYGQSKKDLDRLNFYTNIERKTDKSHLLFSPYYTNEKDPNYSDNSSNGFISFESEIQEYGFQLQDQLNFGDLKATAGIDLGTYDYHSDRYSAKGTPDVPYKPDNKNNNFAIFTQLAYTMGKLDANAGVRFDRFAYKIEANDLLKSAEADEKYSTFNPSFGVQYRLLENLRVHGSFGTAFSVPDAYKVAGKYEVSVYFPDWDYWWKQSYVGNADLKPEKSNTTDLGVKYAIDKALNIDLTYFTTSHSDKIVESTLESGDKTYINANKSNMNGLEMNAAIDFGFLADNHFKLELYSNWTFLFNAEVEIEKDGKTLTQDMLYVRKSSGNFGLSFAKNNFSTRLNGRYTGNRLETDSFNQIRPAYKPEFYYAEGGYEAKDKVIEHEGAVVFDFSLNYKVNQNISIGTTISNLLDENYSEKDGYNMPGRMVLGTVSYSF